MRRIVYLSWPAQQISGGIKMAFRHVEALRDAGYEAYVATPDAQPPNWFATTAPVLPFTDLARDTDWYSSSKTVPPGGQNPRPKRTHPQRPSVNWFTSPRFQLQEVEDGQGGRVCTHPLRPSR
jgi:hypothetical protein